jgi:hypothetical protein
MARAKHSSNKHPSNKRPSKGSRTFAPPPPPEAFGSSPVPASDDQIKTSDFSLHDLFAQQARAMLDRTDLDEEQKQNVLVAMSCPCCGAGGLSFTAKLKRRK